MIQEVNKYTNKESNKLLEHQNIIHIYTFYETKANFGELFIKATKLKIFKYFTEKETFCWIDILLDLTFGYNN